MALNQTSQPSHQTTADDCGNIWLDDASKVILVSLYSATCVLSVGGNLSVIRAVARTASLQTFSNYFLLSLATADLLIGLIMSPIYVVYSIAEEVPAWLLKTEHFWWIATVAASTLSLSAVSIDRYIAITSPLLYPHRMTELRCLGAIVAIWVFSFGFASLRFAFEDYTQLRRLWITTSVVTVVVPISIMAFCYYHMFKVVRIQNRIISEQSSIQNTDNDHVDIGSSRVAAQPDQAKNNRKAALTVAIIVGFFLLMFLPSVVIFLMLLVVTDFCLLVKLNVAWLWAAGVSFAHSAINPWVYALRSAEFRRSLKAIFTFRQQ